MYWEMNDRQILPEHDLLEFIVVGRGSFTVYFYVYRIKPFVLLAFL